MLRAASDCRHPEGMADPRRARRQNTPVREESHDDVCVRKGYDSVSRRAALVDQIVTDDWPSVSGAILAGSVALSVQPEGQGRREPPEIAWGSDIFSRGGRDVKPCCRTRMDSHTPSDSCGMSRPSLCTESATDPIRMAFLDRSSTHKGSRPIPQPSLRVWVLWDCQGAEVGPLIVGVAEGKAYGLGGDVEDWPSAGFELELRNAVDREGVGRILKGGGCSNGVAENGNYSGCLA